MDVLTEYQHRRLDLADMIRAALNIARATHDEQIESQARSLLTRLAGDRFTLAVVGQLSRGKSTLMNAILGADYLPTGVLPMTSVITTVRYGVREHATFLRRDGRIPIEVAMQEVPQLIAQSSDLRAELQVTSVDIELPAELLRRGFAFVDTPGIGSAIGVNAASTRQFLPEADAVVFVTGFDSALTDIEISFLRELGVHTPKLFCVINKRDLVDEHTAHEVATFAQHALERLDFDSPRVFEVSALIGLRAKLASDNVLLAESGLPALETEIERFLTEEKSALLLRNVALRASNIVARQRRELQLGRLSRDGRADPRAVAAAFDEHMAGVRAEQRTLVVRARELIDRDLTGRLKARSPVWRDDLHTALLPEANRILSSRHGVDHTDPPQTSLQQDFETASKPLATDWLRRRSADVTEILVDIVSDQVEQLFGLARSPGAAGARLAGLQLFADNQATGGWATADLPTVATPGPAWSVPMDGIDWTHFRPTRRAAEQRRRLFSAIDRAVVAAEERMRDEFVQLAQRWAENLATQVERQTSETAKRFRHNLRTPPTDDDLAALEDVAVRLASFRADVDAAKPSRFVSAGAISPEALPPTSAMSDCVVCARLRETLIGYLSHSQFRLATRERDQRAHADGFGYCSLHTWTYFTMGSPLGISAGYAAFADAAAQTLETASTLESGAHGLADAMDEVVARRDVCPVCLVLAETEQNAIAELAGEHSEVADTPTLCLDHVALLCAAEPPADRARAAVLALAAALRRDAEDMRSYALKREARYRSLIGGEEAQAYRWALRLLAGDPALARPSSGNKDLEFPSNEQ